MGFLHKLWDETLAGPPPDSGLSKLRKYDSLKALTRLSPPVVDDDVPISRSITIIKTHPTFATNTSSDPNSFLDSPSGPATPRTPLTPETPGGYVKKFTRRKKTEG